MPINALTFGRNRLFEQVGGGFETRSGAIQQVTPSGQVIFGINYSAGQPSRVSQDGGYSGGGGSRAAQIQQQQAQLEAQREQSRMRDLLDKSSRQLLSPQERIELSKLSEPRAVTRGSQAALVRGVGLSPLERYRAIQAAGIESQTQALDARQSQVDVQGQELQNRLKVLNKLADTGNLLPGVAAKFNADIEAYNQQVASLNQAKSQQQGQISGFKQAETQKQRVGSGTAIPKTALEFGKSGILEEIATQKARQGTISAYVEPKKIIPPPTNLPKLFGEFKARAIKGTKGFIDITPEPFKPIGAGIGSLFAGAEAGTAGLASIPALGLERAGILPIRPQKYSYGENVFFNLAKLPFIGDISGATASIKTTPIIQPVASMKGGETLFMEFQTQPRIEFGKASATELGSTLFLFGTGKIAKGITKGAQAIEKSGAALFVPVSKLSKITTLPVRGFFSLVREERAALGAKAILGEGSKLLFAPIIRQRKGLVPIVTGEIGKAGREFIKPLVSVGKEAKLFFAEEIAKPLKPIPKGITAPFAKARQELQLAGIIGKKRLGLFAEPFTTGAKEGKLFFRNVLFEPLKPIPKDIRSALIESKYFGKTKIRKAEYLGEKYAASFDKQLTEFVMPLSSRIAKKQFGLKSLELESRARLERILSEQRIRAQLFGLDIKATGLRGKKFALKEASEFLQPLQKAVKEKIVKGKAAKGLAQLEFDAYKKIFWAHIKVPILYPLELAKIKAGTKVKELFAPIKELKKGIRETKFGMKKQGMAFFQGIGTGAKSSLIELARPAARQVGKAQILGERTAKVLQFELGLRSGKLFTYPKEYSPFKKGTKQFDKILDKRIFELKKEAQEAKELRGFDEFYKFNSKEFTAQARKNALENYKKYLSGQGLPLHKIQEKLKAEQLALARQNKFLNVTVEPYIKPIPKSYSGYSLIPDLLQFEKKQAQAERLKQAQTVKEQLDFLINKKIRSPAKGKPVDIFRVNAAEFFKNVKEQGIGLGRKKETLPNLEELFEKYLSPERYFKERSARKLRLQNLFEEKALEFNKSIQEPLSTQAFYERMKQNRLKLFLEKRLEKGVSAKSFLNVKNLFEAKEAKAARLVEKEKIAKKEIGKFFFKNFPNTSFYRKFEEPKLPKTKTGTITSLIEKTKAKAKPKALIIEKPTEGYATLSGGFVLPSILRARKRFRISEEQEFFRQQQMPLGFEEAMQVGKSELRLFAFPFAKLQTGLIERQSFIGKKRFGLNELFGQAGKQAELFRSVEATKFKYDFGEALKERQGFASRTESQTITGAKTILQPRQGFKARLGFKTFQGLKPITITTKITTKTPKPFLFPLPVLRPLKADSFFGTGFEVFVKRRGRFEKVSREPLTEKSATGLGQLITSQTAARSFFISPVGGRAKRIQAYENINLGGQFRRPIGKTRLPQKAFVEKSKYAINRMGEFIEITQKGQAARKAKGKKLRLF